MKKYLDTKKNNSALIMFLVSIIFGTHFFMGNQDPLFAKAKKITVYAICRVLHNPEQFSNKIGVRGTIIKSNQSKDFMLMTCGKSCEGMPVRFKNKKPSLGKQIEAYGMIKKEKSQYVFYVDKFKNL